MKIDDLKQTLKKLNKEDLTEIQAYVNFLLSHDEITEELEDDFELHGIIAGRVLFSSGKDQKEEE